MKLSPKLKISGQHSKKIQKKSKKNCPKNFSSLIASPGNSNFLVRQSMEVKPKAQKNSRQKFKTAKKLQK
jgi:hypothetical protein